MVKLTTLRTVAAVWLTQVAISAAQISSCPVSETSQTIGGKTFVTCPNSDYQGPSKQVTPNVASSADCAKLCAAATCTKAVYDKIYKSCHFKDDSVTLNWVTSNQFDSMRIGTASATSATTSAAAPTGSCAVSETSQTFSGKTFVTCPNSDYQGPSKQVTQNVASSADCAKLCAATTCTKAVYDKIYKSCHFKDDTGVLTFAQSNQFDSMHIGTTSTTSATTSAAAPTGSCAVSETTQTFSGKSFVTCPNSDYQGPSKQITPNVASSADCANMCATTTCTKAVYDKIYKVCHLKDDTGVLTFAQSNQFDSIHIATANPATSTGSCPVSETTQTIGSKTYITCPNSDYQGMSKEVINNVASTFECAKLCTATTCTKAVYDKTNKVCHLKADTVALTFATNNQFDSMRVTVTSDPAKFGKWSNIINLPVIPVAAYVVPAYPESSRILAFSSYASNDFGGENGLTQFADYNFKNGAVSQREVANTKHDMFCPGMSSLADGRLIVTGGSNAERTSIYDPVSNAFTSGPNMIKARGYQTSATLSNGKVFTIGGSYSGGLGGKDGEIYDPSSNKWTMLPGALVAPMLTDDVGGIWREDNHGWLFGWKDGSVFQAGPSKAMNWYSTTGNGGVQAAGNRDVDDAMCGVWALYDAVNGKIFSAAGSPDYTDSAAVSRAHITTITNVNSLATVERLPDLTYSRGFGNAVILPDGTVIITGGQRISRVFTDFESILAPELFDPKTKSFRVMTPAAVPRNYHSVALLLPDGTIFTGGGGLCYSVKGTSDAHCDRTVDHMNAEIFTPPYLFKPDGSPAVRPVISSVSSSVATNGYTARVGGTITIKMADTNGGTTFSLVRIGSVTHSVNSDQRRVPLTKLTQNGATWTITLPTDAGILLPGTWYLFAMSADGVPSMAKTVKVTI